MYHILSQQKEVFIPPKKELRFFSYHYDKGFDWYCNTYFKDAQNEKCIGEADPAYLSDERVPERILKHCGSSTKIIMIFRQPVKRAYSHYNMFKKFEKFKNWVTYPFEEQLKLENSGDIKSNYISNGLYSKALNDYLKHFDRSNIHIIYFGRFYLKSGKSIEWTGKVFRN